MRLGCLSPARPGGGLTLTNAAKPVVVDDTAYLFFARQIATHPTDPTVRVVWYMKPDPAMTYWPRRCCRYWLAAGSPCSAKTWFC